MHLSRFTESRIESLELAAEARPRDLLSAERRFGDELHRQQTAAQAAIQDMEVYMHVTLENYHRYLGLVMSMHAQGLARRVLPRRRRARARGDQAR